MDWLALKNESARLLLEKDALHIYAALLIQVGTAKLSRRSLGDLSPWLAVLGIELLNEWMDLLRGQEAELRPWQVVSGVHDIINTMILPTVLLMLCRSDAAMLRWTGKVAPGVGARGQVASDALPDDAAARGQGSQPVTIQPGPR